MWSKKGQTATEYLIILAVVIVIALVVVVAMGRFPGMGQGAASQASQVFWSTQDIAITSYAVAEDGVVVNVRNNMRSTIDIKSIKIGQVTINREVTLATGRTERFNSSDGANCNNQGDPFSLDVEIEYTDRDTGATYTFTGSNTPIEGTCASSIS